MIQSRVRYIVCTQLIIIIITFILCSNYQPPPPPQMNQVSKIITIIRTILFIWQRSKPLVWDATCPPPPPQQQQYQPPPPQQQQYQQQQPQQQYQQAPVQPVQAQHGSHGGEILLCKCCDAYTQTHIHMQIQNFLSISRLLHADKNHIQEHMDVPIDTSKMSEQELQFHYFKMHDADNNNKLDGCELIKSLIHWHGPGEEPKEQRIVYQDKDFEEMANGALEQADFNNDGFIDYAEFRRATGV
ncbi:hypothetical protein K1T71_015102 [Dendrolimus kikuchii]|nr:hypothetical protein K1T71_015102 [Dendrolimus kikuchii]